MYRRKSWIVLIAALALTLGLAACGGGEKELDLDQYFRQLEDINDSTQARIDILQEESQGVGVEIEPTRDYVDGLQAITKEALNDLKDLHPPAEARDAHDEFVAGLSELLALREALGDRLADLESPSELQTLLVEPDEPVTAATRRVDNARCQLQGIAGGNGIEVDLGCG